MMSAAQRALRNDIVIGCILLALAVAAPFVVDSRFAITQTIVFFIWAMVTVQWNLVFGYAGIFSLAQMVIFAFGAYMTAVIGLELGWSVWAAAPVAAVGAVGFSLILGLACLRLTGAYVALLTLAVAQIAYVLIRTETLPLGGQSGMSRFGDLGFRPMLGADWYIGNYYVGLTLLTISIIFSIIVIRGPLGLAFQALRDSPGLARARGISRLKYQLWVFGATAFFTGLAGGFYAAHFRIVGPQILSLSLLLFMLAMVVIGGRGRVWGALIGTGVLLLTDELLREVAGDYRNLVLGLLIALFVMFMPQGIAGALSAGVDKVKNRLTRKRETPSSH